MVDFGDRLLRPAEVLLLVRYREALSARVLDVGCGNGRMLGYLVALGGEVHGVDLSAPAIDTSARRYPEAKLRIADVRELTPATDGRFDAVLAAHGLLDTFDAAARTQVLAIFRELLSPSGLLIFSSHNAAADDRGAPGRRGARELLSRLDKPPSHYGQAAARLRDRMRDQPRLRTELHQITRRDQQRQLDDLGLEVLDCIDLDGQPVAADEDGVGPELYWIAQLRRSR